MSRQAKEVMNRALDRELDSEEREALHIHLDRSSEDAHAWAKLQRVDRMLHAAPLLDAPVGFAERVLAVISAGRVPQVDRRRGGLSVALGLGLATTLAIPLLGALLYVLGRMLFDPTALASVVDHIRTVIASAAAWLSTVTQASAATMDLWAIAALLLVAAAAGLSRVAAAPSREITYRIPVKILS